jgi:predicted nucleic acid-binding Zn ribbon protein
MPTYIYETIPDNPHAAPRRFEVRQAMNEPPLAVDPETGAPVRRVISGGLTVLTKGRGKRRAVGGTGLRSRHVQLRAVQLGYAARRIPPLARLQPLAQAQPRPLAQVQPRPLALLQPRPLALLQPRPLALPFHPLPLSPSP